MSTLEPIRERLAAWGERRGGSVVAAVLAFLGGVFVFAVFAAA